VEQLRTRPELLPAVALVRRPPTPPLPEPVEALQVDFALPAQAPIRGSTVFCALGTTLAQAGSKQAFAAVDRDLVVALATRARDAGVDTFVAVTAAGANSRSLFHYNRVKGETEQRLRALGFARLALLRPSLLLGARSASRPGEAVAQALLGPLRGLTPAAFRAVPGASVALAMVKVAVDRGWAGVRELSNAQIHALAGERVQS